VEIDEMRDNWDFRVHRCREILGRISLRCVWWNYMARWWGLMLELQKGGWIRWLRF